MVTKRPPRKSPPVPKGKAPVYAEVPIETAAQIEALRKLTGCRKNDTVAAALRLGARALVGPALVAHLLQQARYVHSEAS